MASIPHGGGVVSLRAMSDQDGAGADHVLANRASWDADAHDWVDRGRISWAAEEITWGIWSVPERELRLLPQVRGLDAVELGCGTGYVSSWLAPAGSFPRSSHGAGRIDETGGRPFPRPVRRHERADGAPKLVTFTFGQGKQTIDALGQPLHGAFARLEREQSRTTDVGLQCAGDLREP